MIPAQDSGSMLMFLPLHVLLDFRRTLYTLKISTKMSILVNHTLFQRMSILWFAVQSCHRTIWIILWRGMPFFYLWTQIIQSFVCYYCCCVLVLIFGCPLFLVFGAPLLVKYKGTLINKIELFCLFVKMFFFSFLKKQGVFNSLPFSNVTYIYILWWIVKHLFRAE